MGNMDKLSLGVVAQIVVAKEVVWRQKVGQIESCLLKWLLVQVVANTNSAADDEVHLKNFFLLIVYNIFILCVAEMAWFQAKSNVVKEFAVLVLLRVEEESEVVKNIIK